MDYEKSVRLVAVQCEIGVPRLHAMLGVLQALGAITINEIEWQRKARIGQKIYAIKAYREMTGAPLEEARRAVEQYIAEVF